MTRIKISLLPKAILVKAALYSTYLCGLTFVYLQYITKIFAYEGFVEQYSVRNFTASLIVVLIAATLLPQKPEKPSAFLLHLTMGLVVVPSLTLFSGSSLPDSYIVTTLSSFTMMALASQFIKVPRFKAFSTSSRNVTLFCLAFVGFILASIIAFGGWRYLNFNFLKVYDLRRSAAAILPGIYAYLTPWAGKVLIPFGLVLSALQKNWRNTIFFLLSSILLFGLTAHKAPFFYPFIILFIYWISGKKQLIDIFIIALIVVVLTGGLDFSLFVSGGNSASPVIGTTLVRRALVIPSLINWFYLDFFSQNPHYFWSQSTFSLGLIDSPFDLNFANLIGREYFDSADSSANTGWIGSGYANAGLAGVYIYSIVIGLFFSFLDSYAERLGLPFVLSVFSIPVITIITSTDLTTMLLTHGLLLSLLLLSVIRPKSLYRANKKRQLSLLGI